MPQSLFAVLRSWGLPADVKALGAELVGEGQRGATLGDVLTAFAKKPEADVVCFLAEATQLQELIGLGYGKHPGLRQKPRDRITRTLGGGDS